MSLALFIHIYIYCLSRYSGYLASPQLRWKNTRKTHINYINNLITMTLRKKMMMQRGRQRERVTRGDSDDDDDDVAAAVARCSVISARLNDRQTWLIADRWQGPPDRLAAIKIAKLPRTCLISEAMGNILGYFKRTIRSRCLIWNLP